MRTSEFPNRSVSESLTLTITREEVDAACASEDPNKALLDLLEKDLGDRLGASVGVWEGYTLREHLEMVLHQFDTYKAESQSLPVDNNFFRVFLALHDIGKPDAVKCGEPPAKYIVPLADTILEKLQYPAEKRVLAKALLSKDYIGRHAKFGEPPEEVAHDIAQAAQEAGISASDFWKILLAYFKFDASSYTRDAGGKESLDRLFRFDHEQGAIDFSPDLKVKIERLRGAIDKYER